MSVTVAMPDMSVTGAMPDVSELAPRPPASPPVDARRATEPVDTRPATRGVDACGGSSLTRRVALRTASDALTQFAQFVAELPTSELAPLLSELDVLARRATAGRVAVTAEAIRRGAVAASSSASVTDWVGEHAPSQRADGAWATAKAAEALTVGRRPGQEALAEAILDGSLSPGTAVTVAAEFERIGDRLRPEAAETVLEAMASLGERAGSRGVKNVRSELLNRFGAPGDLQRDQDLARRSTSLSAPRPDLPGCFRYELVLDAESKAVLEAAIGPLSRPQPGPGGRPDTRPAARRRAESLVEVCRRATEHATEPRVPTSVKAAVYVTLSLEDLVNRSAAGTTLATPADSALTTGGLLGADTIRKLACDAGVIPVVLGRDGEVLDVGRQHRLFTRGQLKALWLRDRQCTFPMCTAPAFWTDAHHLIHWADDGPTDLDNAALLCGRHHTVVHTKRLSGRVTAVGVEWVLTPESYEEALVQFRRSR